MKTVLPLEQSVINKISAGEVAEDCATVIKELVENSIDAKSSTITVEISAMGMTKIVVRDNGIGLSKEDLLQAILMHTTSKITAIEDLLSIKSLGFRGEALASIVAVSEFEILSSNNSRGLGTKIAGSYGQVERCTPCPKTRGTTIIIKNIFKNVPVRCKHQKNSKKKIVNVLMSFALYYDAIAFKLIADDKLILNASTFSNRLDRIKQLFNVTPTIHKSTFEKSSLELYLGNFSNYLFVNGRVVKSTLITKAIESNFYFMAENPKFIAYIAVDGKDVDVNIHPQKKEVRFYDNSLLFKLVDSAIIKTTPKELPFTKPKVFSPSKPQVLFESPVDRVDTIFETIHTIAKIDHFFIFQRLGISYVCDLKKLLLATLFVDDTSQFQQLSPALVIDLTAEQFAILNSKKKFFEQIMDFRPIGKRDIAVDAMLPFIGAKELVRLITFATNIDPNFDCSAGLCIMKNKTVVQSLKKMVEKKVFSPQEALLLVQKYFDKDLVSYSGHALFVELNSTTLERLLK